MEIDVRISGARATVVLTGRLTGDDSIQALRDTIDDLLERGAEEVVLDLEAVPSVDSAGLGAIVRVHTTVARRRARLKLVNLPPRVRDVLTITKLTTVFDVFAPESRDARWHGAVWATFWVLLVLALVIIWRFSGVFGGP